MVEPDLSRRSVLFAAGAVAILSGCNKQAASNSETGERDVSMMGIDPSYGDDPHGDFPSTQFSPKYITLVKISSQGPWDISSNHASFPCDGMTDSARMELAAKIFKRFKEKDPDDPSSASIYKFSELKKFKNDHGIAKRKDNKYDSDDFTDFNFGRQHEIYIWFDSKDVELVSTANGPHLIGMSAKRSNGTNTAKNKSFYARPFGPTPTPLKGPIIVVRNYFLDESGATIKGYLQYSMNIFFQVKNKQGNKMTLILDPDTGNGVGNDPLIGA